MTIFTAFPTGTSAADLFFADFANEHASTRRLLERYPDGKGEWRPHDKSRTLGALATHVADIVNRGVNILESDTMDTTGRQPIPPIDSAAGLLAHFDAAVTTFTTALNAADADSLAKSWSITRGEQVLLQAPKRGAIRTVVMSHLVHHRAQLGVYYRLLGVAVPGMYGPSADDLAAMAAR